MTDTNTPTAAGPGQPTAPTGESASVVSTPVVDTPTASPPKKPRKGGCGCMMPVLLLLATFGFAPQIVMQTSLRNQLPSMLMAELPPGVVIGSASAGWISPIQLNDIVIPDDQGRPSLRLKHVTLSKSLWELARSTDDLGEIAVEKPALNLYLDNGVSNYDQFLARLSAKKGSGKRSLIDLALTDGELVIREETRSPSAPVGQAPRTAGTEIVQVAGTSQGPQEVAPDNPDASFVAPAFAQVDSGSVEPTPPEIDSPIILPANDPAAAAPQAIPPVTGDGSNDRPAPKPPVEGPVIARIDLKSATFKSQKDGEEELLGELTAVLREPAVEQSLTGTLSWNLPSGGESGIGSGKLRLVVPPVPLAMLSPWLAPFTSGRDLSGEVSLEANAEVVPSGNELLVAARVKVPHLDLQLSPADAQKQPFRWVGDNLELVAEGQGDLAGQLVTLEQVQLRTPIVNADFAGTVRDLAGQMICGLTGTCNLNPADLLEKLPAEWAGKIQIQGLQLGAIRVEGALRQAAESAKPPAAVVEGAADVANQPAVTEASAMPLHINADLQWTSADLFGFRSENALVNVDWSERQLSINPNRLPIGEGRWVASPRIQFAAAGNTLVFDGGPVFENVDFTQEMSDSWLRYVSPILGSATSIEGKFSLSAAPARVALQPPYAGKFQGVLDIHSAQVGPGQLTRQIVDAIHAIQTILGRQPALNLQAMQVDKQQVQFVYQDGRVYHKDLKVGYGDVVVQSAGSVGLDETIDFQLTVPIPDKWTTARPLLANLKGESIPFQMNGTLDQPQLDGKALGDFGKRVGLKSAGGLIQQLIQKRLDQKANGGATPSPRPKRVR